MSPENLILSVLVIPWVIFTGIILIILLCEIINSLVGYNDAI